MKTLIKEVSAVILFIFSVVQERKYRQQVGSFEHLSRRASRHCDQDELLQQWGMLPPIDHH